MWVLITMNVLETEIKGRQFKYMVNFTIICSYMFVTLLQISVLSHPTSWIKVSLKPIIVYDPHPHTQKSLKGKFLQAFYGFKCLRCKY
jgi:hypothetical protein